MSAIKRRCPGCGNLIEEGLQICRYCGRRENGKRCPGCGQYIAEEDASCPHCGFHLNGAHSEAGSKQKRMLSVVLILLVLGLIVGVSVLRRQDGAASDSEEISSSPASVMTEAANLSDEASETETSGRSTADAENPYEQMLSAGSYAEALDAILVLDIADLDVEEQDALADMLQRAAEGQYAQFEEHIGSLQNAGDFDGALTAVDEQAGLYNRIAESAFASHNIDIQWPLAEQRAGIMRSHVSYLLDMGRSEAVYQWDEAELNSNVLDRLQSYVDEGILTQEEFDRKRAVIYGIFVNETIASMGRQGVEAASILSYIAEKIADTGYNCQTIEYWDYYMSVIGKGAGNPTLVSARSADGYLLPGSDSATLGAKDVSGLSRDELRLGIYEIFARHGYVFQDQAVNTYFRNCPWYEIDSSFEEETLNQYERSNLAMLVDYMFNRYL